MISFDSVDRTPDKDVLFCERVVRSQHRNASCSPRLKMLTRLLPRLSPTVPYAETTSNRRVKMVTSL